MFRKLMGFSVEGYMSRIVSKSMIVLVILCFLFVGCSSSTLINSRPEGAELYIDGVRMGLTPYKYSDMAPLGTSKVIRLEKPGYKPLNTIIRKEEFKVGPCIGGVLVLFPFIWLLGYPDRYEYPLESI